jgi:antitoxin (DNA-binding transcriptional repressor) of toxin-antitoxin stability system
MTEQVIQASVFRTQCLAILDDVVQTPQSVVIAKHGKAIARLVPIDGVGRPTIGSVTPLNEADEAYFSTSEAWDLELAAPRDRPTRR